MNQDTDLFVQAFWVKCREVIRPEIDARIGDLRRTGHDADVSTHEFSEVADGLPAPSGPSLRLAILPGDATADAVRSAIEFHGDVQRQAIDVLTDGVRSQSFDLDALGTAEVKAAIDDWLARRTAAAPV
jgi:hypothetical protein